MKVKELQTLLDSLESKFENLSKNKDLEEIIQLYDELTNNSGYFFSQTTPNGIRHEINDMIGDIYEIRKDIENQIQDFSQDLEL